MVLSNYLVYQVPHVDGMFVLHPPLREGENPLKASDTVVVHQYAVSYGTYWLCLRCSQPLTAVPCVHVSQVQEWLREKEEKL